MAREAAGLEAVHGDLGRALALFDTAIDSFHRAGNVANMAMTFADLAVLFDRIERPEIAATLYGASTHHGDIGWVLNLPAVVDHLREVLGEIRLRRVRRRRGGHGVRRRRALRGAADSSRQLGAVTSNLTSTSAVRWQRPRRTRRGRLPHASVTEPPTGFGLHAKKTRTGSWPRSTNCPTMVASTSAVASRAELGPGRRHPPTRNVDEFVMGRAGHRRLVPGQTGLTGWRIP